MTSVSSLFDQPSTARSDRPGSKAGTSSVERPGSKAGTGSSERPGSKAGAGSSERPGSKAGASNAVRDENLGDDDSLTLSPSPPPIGSATTKASKRHGTHSGNFSCL